MVSDYLTDLSSFAEWVTLMRDESFKPKAITPTDKRDYRRVA
jgi:hypothetical protein